MFWAYGNFSRLELMCANSFINNNYNLHIWTYGDLPNAPKGAVIRDAREIISENLVFLNKVGSYASFSDFFRYTVLAKFGGLYSDTDVVALKNSSELPGKKFLVTERDPQGGLKVNNNIIFNPVPMAGNVIDLAQGYSERFPKNDITWGEIGPSLLTLIVQAYPNHGFDIYPPEFANHINYWECPKFLLENNAGILPAQSHFIHLYNEMWRRSGVDKNKKYNPDGLYEFMVEKYLNLN
jgi:mannosyltransferase OCH1-like enzyme